VSTKIKIVFTYVANATNLFANYGQIFQIRIFQMQAISSLRLALTTQYRKSCRLATDNCDLAMRVWVGLLYTICDYKIAVYWGKYFNISKLKTAN